MRIIIKHGLKVVTAGLLLAGLGWLATFKVQEVKCVVQDHPCSAEAEQQAQTLNHRSFFFTDLEKVGADNLSSLPGYQLVSIQRQLPQTVVLTLQQNAALYRLRQIDTNETVVVDTQGYFYTADQQESLPLVVVVDKNQNPDRHTQLVDLFKTLTDEHITFKQIEVVSDNVALIYLDGQTTAVINVSSPIQDTKKLSIVLKGIEPGTLSQIQEIDVRYRLPVLRPIRTIPRHDS